MCVCVCVCACAYACLCVCVCVCVCTCACACNVDACMRAFVLNVETSNEVERIAVLRYVIMSTVC